MQQVSHGSDALRLVFWDEHEEFDADWIFNSMKMFASDLQRKKKSDFSDLSHWCGTSNESIHNAHTWECGSKYWKSKHTKRGWQCFCWKGEPVMNGMNYNYEFCLLVTTQMWVREKENHWKLCMKQGKKTFLVFYTLCFSPQKWKLWMLCRLITIQLFDHSSLLNCFTIWFVCNGLSKVFQNKFDDWLMWIWKNKSQHSQL